MAQLEEKGPKASIESRRSLSVASPRSFLSSTSTVSTKLDRLEKFFSKKAKVAAIRESLFGSSRSATPVLTSSQTGPISQAFPSPSFIRPTSNRMFARDEAAQSDQPTRRAHSLPETTSLQPSQEESSRSAPPLQSPKVPKRSSSLFHRRGNGNHSIAALLDFNFPEKSLRRSLDTSPRTSATASPSPLSSPTRRKSPTTSRSPEDLLLAFPSHRPDTPPQSDQEDCSRTSTPTFPNGLPATPPLAVVAAAGPTPDSSPKLLSLLESRISATRTETPSPPPQPHPRRHKSLSGQEKPTVDMAHLRKASSHTALNNGAPPAQTKSPTLKEPTLTEFLSLSDDDVADDRPVVTLPSKPPSVGLPPNPPPPHVRAQDSTAYPLLTLSSPIASRPATAAAFEVARIAARYQFDLVYVVNLWPNNLLDTLRRGSDSTGTIRPTSPESSCPDTQTPRSPPSAKPGLTGRLLAAYGLPAITSPFRISAPVHQKVLRTDGWLEYRSEHLAPGEFSSGYSCSFYTDNDVYGRPRTSTPTSTSTTTSGRDSPRSSTSSIENKKQPLRHNTRGIVFAAYRLPQPDGTTISSDISELDALYLDAEALVEMLIDIHSMQRSRYPRGKHDSEETGPMPLRPLLS